MTTDPNKSHLWTSFAKLDDAGDVKAAVAFVLDTPLKHEVNAQRYVGWANAQKGDMISAGAWYLKAASQGDKAAIEDCYEFAKLLDSQGDEKALTSFVETPLLHSMERFQRLMVSFYYRTGMKSKVLEWSILLAKNNREEDLIYLGKLYLSSGLPENAVPYLSEAADAGSGEANELMGEMYWQGLGVTQDQERASAHYSLSSRKGFLHSQSRLLHIKRRQRSIWHLPIFAFGVIRLAFKARALHARNPEDPRLDLLRAKKLCMNDCKGPP